MYKKKKNVWEVCEIECESPENPKNGEVIQRTLLLKIPTLAGSKSPGPRRLSCSASVMWLDSVPDGRGKCDSFSASPKVQAAFTEKQKSGGGGAHCRSPQRHGKDTCPCPRPVPVTRMDRESERPLGGDVLLWGAEWCSRTGSLNLVGG